MASLLSINVGISRPLVAGNKIVQSGIFKSAVAGPVRVSLTGLAGDERVDHAIKSATERAVYVYPSEHYSFWRDEFPAKDVAFGTFGENLTTEGLGDEQVCIGDQYRIGSVVLTVTQPRMPCYKLAARMQRTDMIERMIAVRRHGFFFSVAQEGTINVGDTLQRVHREPASISVPEAAGLYTGRLRDVQLLERAMALKALPGKWKTRFAQRAQAAGVV